VDARTIAGVAVSSAFSCYNSGRLFLLRPGGFDDDYAFDTERRKT
jgi:hypothetical protein